MVRTLTSEHPLGLPYVPHPHPHLHAPDPKIRAEAGIPGPWRARHEVCPTLTGTAPPGTPAWQWRGDAGERGQGRTLPPALRLLLLAYLSACRSFLSPPLFSLCLSVPHSLILLFGLLVPEKPLPQGGPGIMERLLGCAVAMVLILSVAVTVFFLYHRQQMNRLEMDGGG